MVMLFSLYGHGGLNGWSPVNLYRRSRVYGSSWWCLSNEKTIPILVSILPSPEMRHMNKYINKYSPSVITLAKYVGTAVQYGYLDKSPYSDIENDPYKIQNFQRILGNSYSFLHLSNNDGESIWWILVQAQSGKVARGCNVPGALRLLPVKPSIMVISSAWTACQWNFQPEVTSAASAHVVGRSTKRQVLDARVQGTAQ